MPIKNVQDAIEVHNHIDKVFSAQPDERAQAIRQLFVEALDFNPDSGQLSLRSAPAGVSLPPTAQRIAVLNGVHVCYVALDISESDRVRKQEAVATARQLANELGDDLLLVFTNTSGSQLHLVHPLFETAQPTLRRMVVERDLPRRTAVQQVANIYSNYLASRSIRDALESAFDVEPVTKRFFAEYKRVFEQAEEFIIESDDDQAADWRMFVQTLFNRLMFVHFLSRKGWLTFDDDTDYLNALWRSYRSRPNETSFYRHRLCPLFFCGLNNPDRPDGYMSSVFGDAPFLNGGLFERTDLDQRTQIDVPDEALRPVLQELFDRFNFTVMESTPFDIEVAVDPEMLGKVFEELVTGRHESGAYYTPRPVVAFMCREALKGHLESHDVGLSPEAIQGFVDERDTTGVSLAAAPKISRALDEITVVDPACGSGAYLLGMLQELVDLQIALFNVGVDTRSLYHLKLHIVERNLYGVDNDDFAVNMAMLRLWLSLAIEYEGDKPEPLPNLDLKIVCGDSLQGPEPIYQLQVVHSKLGDLKTQYMHATEQVAKEDLRICIEAERARVEKVLGGAGAPAGSINWRLDFAEVFETHGGFDVAIANPPYVRHEEIGHIKQLLRDLYSSATTARSDLYCYFYVRAFQVLRADGIHVFVCSNTWLDATYGAKLQHYLLANSHLMNVYESAIERQFSTADVNTIITVLSKSDVSSDALTKFVSFQSPFTLATSDQISRRERIVTRATLEGSLFDQYSSHISPRLSSGKWGGKYLRAPEIYTIFMELASTGIHRLGDLVRGERYLNTGGADGFFVLVDVTPHSPSLMKVTARSKEGNEWGNPEFLIEKDFLRAGYRRSGSPYLQVSESDCHILVIPPDTDTSQYRVSEYITWAEDVGFHARSVTRTQSPWWKPPLQARSGSVILWPRTHSDSHRCYYNPGRLVSLRFFRMHPMDQNMTIPILAILNSTLFAMLKEIHGRRGLGQGALETGLVDMLPLPMPKLEPSVCAQLSAAIQPLLARAVMKLSDEVEETDRQELDRIVLQSYGLAPDVVKDIYYSVSELVLFRQQKAKSLVT